MTRKHWIYVGIGVGVLLLLWAASRPPAGAPTPGVPTGTYGPGGMLLGWLKGLIPTSVTASDGSVTVSRTTV